MNMYRSPDLLEFANNNNQYLSCSLKPDKSIRITTINQPTLDVSQQAKLIEWLFDNLRSPLGNNEKHPEVEQKFYATIEVMYKGGVKITEQDVKRLLDLPLYTTSSKTINIRLNLCLEMGDP